MKQQLHRTERATRRTALLLLWMLPVAAQAQFLYTTNSGTLTITGYTGPGGAVTIPGTIDGLPVMGIGNSAFSNNASLTNVTIPVSVTSIGVWAFDGCVSLQNVTFGTGVTNIGWGAFYSCASLASVTIPDGVTYIGGWTFYSCFSLTNITIPNTITGIYGQALGSCTNLGSVLIPDSVNTIGEYAFDSCFSLTNLTIGESITNIGDEAFRACRSLSAITVDARNPFYSSIDGVLLNKSQTTLIQCPGGKAGSFTVPKSVTEIRDHAFNYCSGLTHLYFQTNSPIPGMNVFYGATNLTNYYMPNTCCYGMTFGGRPAVPWNPRMRTSDGHFGVRTNAFGFNITGTSNLVIVVEACTNPVNPAWSIVGTNTLTGGSSYFSDPEWTNHPARYYRLRSP